MRHSAAQAAAALVLMVAPALAQEWRITPDLPDLRLALKGQEVVIARSPDALPVPSGNLPSCPPHCPQPIEAAPGVKTVGALEVIGFLQSDVAEGRGHLLDLRLPEEFAAAHLPGAINMPAVTLSAENPARRDILRALGAAETAGGLDFAAAAGLVIHGAGPLHAEAAEGVRALLAVGYPADRLWYFRGGLQEWQDFGLTVSGQTGAH